MKLRVLSRMDIGSAVSMAQAIEAVKGAFVQLSAGRAVVPIRTHLEVSRRGGISLSMPAYLQESDELGLKIASFFPRNPERGLPAIHALVALLDAETGCPVAIMDGAYLTALRTGAASGAATELLARGDARVAAVIGAGVQGRTQLEAVCQVRDIECVRVYDVSREAAEVYTEEMRQRGGRIPADIVVASSAAEAVQGADVICTATPAHAAVFADADLATGAHLNAVGGFTPEMQEVPEETVARARIVVDSREACWAEAGDLIIPRDRGLISEADIHAELGEIVAQLKPGRETDTEITLFKSVGNAVQDVAVATKALKEADRLGLGLEIEL
jgi:ornithine cyclodeaminase